MRRNPWTIVGITLPALIIASYTHEIISPVSGYEWLHSHQPFYIAESIDKVLGVVVCVFAMWLMYRTDLRGTSRELGLSAPVLPAIAFGLVASLPMLIGFAVTRNVNPHVDIVSLLFLTVFSPLVEEIEFRGFGVLQLQRGTGWPFWIVVWPSALLFGLGHVEQGESLEEMLGLFLLTGAGGVTFAWLVYRWQNLWVATALHVVTNLWWRLFSVSKNAIGGWFPFAVQNLTMVLAILITLCRTEPRRAALSSDSAR